MFRPMPISELACGLLLALTCGAVFAAAPPPPAPSAEALAGLIRQLGAEEFEGREAASSRLRLIGRASLPTLRKVTAHRDPEVLQRCKDLIAWIDADRISLRAKGAVFRTLGNDPDADVTDAHLAGKQFGDDDLDRLASMRDLVDLDLRGAAVTDAGLAKLARFSRLSHLSFQETCITGSGLVYLSGLRDLRCLELVGASIEDKSLAHLAALTHLSSLALAYTPVTDSGLALLRGSGVQSLGINNTRVTDDGLRHVRTMKNLKFLNLQRTAITIRGLKHLEGHEDLRQIEMPPLVSEKDRQAFQRKLPKYGNWDW